MTKLRALIFDVDGTLADTEQYGHRVAFNRAFADAGFDWDWSVLLYGELLTVAGGKERIRFYLQQHRPDFQPATNLDELIAKLHKAKTQNYQQLVGKRSIPLRPGVKRLLEEAHSQGMRLAIATTTALTNVTTLLKQTLGADSPSWFEVIAAGDIVPAKKPAPDIYKYVLQTMGLEPQECVAIEDSYQGLQAALKAGIKTVVTVNDYTRNDDFSGAILVLNHLGEPEEPFTLLAGDAGDASYLDMVLVNRLCDRE
ncbi:MULTISPECIES: HAD-IA family hydrolase [unclassified Coleofasciculus]|uniref:HAD-IA family hydrolase n=1 Tax=unclassified Coleofasciculus TaxID=2692782 RepID=UPI00187FA386|nr:MULTISPECIES: HAD-IA family hydrolase [unclassified Coleofasciculus]MBE9126159.1 HAD-IA family hydrolase [Coleofasciculus sp. LEGE 07081]MBE9149577.1 HAD-IA family hydrolase [Coleofasciculus sp. LEGE 07092]